MRLPDLGKDRMSPGTAQAFWSHLCPSPSLHSLPLAPVLSGMAASGQGSASVWHVGPESVLATVVVIGGEGSYQLVAELTMH